MSRDWVRVCRLDDIPPGEMRAVEDEALPPVVVFNVGGALHATSNICTHNVAMLSDGSFDGRIIECPLHGGAFDVVTGEPTAHPCEIALQRFSVRVEDGEVFVQPTAENGT